MFGEQKRIDDLEAEFAEPREKIAAIERGGKSAPRLIA
jgi:hypothetical protein